MCISWSPWVEVCNTNFALTMGSGTGHPGASALVAVAPRAAPRARLQGPQTTSTSVRRSGLPAALRSQALGRWSACKSSTAPQSLQKFCNRRALLLSLVHCQS